MDTLIMAKNTKEITSDPEMPIGRLLNKAEAGMSLAASTNVWKDPKVSLELSVDKESFNKTVDLCRFFYKTEPVVATVINKLVEIAMNDLIVSKTGLSDNEHRVFTSLKPRIMEFAETMAQELLISGLVVPEIGYGPMDKDEIFELGIKKYNRLILPVSMWVRDPNSIKIYSSMMSDSPSFFVVVPDEVIYFIKSKGKYPSGNTDKDLYDNFKTYYPEFVKRINAGEKEFLIDNKLILRRKYLTNNPYPISYIEPALEALQHKRRMRRMDYSIMDKVISAIMHIKVGSDEFPITDSEEDAKVFSDIKNQLMFRFQSDQNLERIFQLITNHTVEIDWVFPDSSLLSDNNRYANINEEILFALGFPRILITGESSRSGTSSPEIAILSPIKTIESLRRKLIKVIRDIFRTVAERNNFKAPSVKFKPLNLHSFTEFVGSLEKLYNISGVSRASVSEFMGYDFLEELDKLELENNELKKRKLPEFGPQPFSRNSNNTSGDPGSDNSEGETGDETQNNQPKAKVTKPKSKVAEE
jgi:hypothetical protein